MGKVCEVQFNLNNDCEDDAVEYGEELLSDVDSANRINLFFESIGLSDKFNLIGQKDIPSAEDLTELDDIAEQKGLLDGLVNNGLIETDEAEMLRNGIFEDISLEDYSPEDLINIFGLSEEEVSGIISSYYANKQQRLAEIQQTNVQEQLKALTKDICNDEDHSGTLQDIMSLLGVENTSPRGKNVAKRARGKYLLENVFQDNQDFANEPVNKQIRAVREQVRGQPEQEKNLKILSGFYHQAYNQTNGDGKPYQINDKESVNLKYDPAQKSMSLIVKNLNESGLSFAVNTHEASNGYQTLVLTNDESEMTEAQIKELAGFFFKGGLIKDSKDLTLPPTLKVKDAPSLKAQDVFDQAFAAQRQAHQQIENEQEKDNVATRQQPQHQEPPQQNQDTALSGAASGNSSSTHDVYDSYLSSKPLNPDYRAMRGAMEARAGIMGFRKNRLHWRRNLDGSMTLIAYLNEADERTDSELDKKGLQSRKKAFAVKVHKGPPPASWLYIEPGKEIKSGHAKLILKAFQSQGCQYFTAGPTVELGGAGNSAFWKAAGSIPICPKLKCSKNDDGFDGFANDNLQEMLKVHKEEAKIDPTTSLLWKMRLVKELKGYTQFKRESGKPDGKLETATAVLEGDIKFSKFQASYQGQIQKFINNGVNNLGWNAADLASAYGAIVKMMKGIDEGTIPYNFLGDYVGEGASKHDIQADKLIDFLTKTMAEERVEVNKKILEAYDANKNGENKNNSQSLDDDNEYEGKALVKAGTDVLQIYRESLDRGIIGDLKDSYGEAGDIKFSLPSKAASISMESLKRPTPMSGKTVDGQDRQALYNRSRPVNTSIKKSQLEY